MAIRASIATVLLMLATGTMAAPAYGAIEPGTIVIEDPAADAKPADATPLFIDAVERELLDADFLTLPNRGGSRYLARVAVTKTSRGQVTADPREAGPDVRAGNWNAGVTVTLPSDKRQLRDLVATELDVTILSRKDDLVVWRGRAVTVQPAGSPTNDSKAVAAKLAGALFKRFPQPATETIAVP